MSHHEERFSLEQPQLPVFQNGIVTLPVSGQGVVFFSPENKSTQLEILAPNREENTDLYQYFCYSIEEHETAFYASKKSWASVNDKIFTCNKGFNLYPEGPFWFSIDFENRLLKGGYGEPRAELALFSFKFDTGELTEGNVGPILKPTEKDDPELSKYRWLKEMKHVNLSKNAILYTVFKDPITVNAAMAVKDMNDITMWDVANYEATVPANLPSVCQKLYENVGGESSTFKPSIRIINCPKTLILPRQFNTVLTLQGKFATTLLKKRQS